MSTLIHVLTPLAMWVFIALAVRAQIREERQGGASC